MLISMSFVCDEPPTRERQPAFRMNMTNGQVAQDSRICLVVLIHPSMAERTGQLFVASLIESGTLTFC